MRAIRMILLGAVMAMSIPGCAEDETLNVPEIKEMKKILIGGSESVLPIFELLAEAFVETNPSTGIDFGAPGHTGAGIKAVHSDIFTIGALSRKLKSREKEYGLKELWFAKDALVFCTHSSVKLRNLSSEDVRAIYYGEITNWKELGGPDHEIVVLDRPADSSPKVLLYSNLFFNKERNILSSAVVLKRPQEMNYALKSSPYSIGYTSFASVSNNDYEDVNVLKLDNVRPSPENVKKGNYSLARPQGFVIKDSNEDIAREFIDFIFGEKGQNILVKRGYAPLDGTL